jgi:hypothetical protein
MAENPAPGGGRGEDPAGGPVPGFASGGPLDCALPSAALTRDLDKASGPGQRCDGATDDEVAGMLGRWEATEAWCASAKLGVIRALIRRRGLPGFGPEKPGGLPGAWQEGLTQEVSNELGVSLRAADGLIELAAALDARLVLTREALAAGVISLVKARIIAEATAVLDDDRAAVAETLIADQLAGKTPGQVAALIARAVVQVDPEGARKRRERAQREDARVRFWREHAGTAALAAFGLPPDEALAANQHIQARALAYRAAGIAGTLDQLRVRAFLDALNGTPAPAPASTGGGSAPSGPRHNGPGLDGPADGTDGGPGHGGNGPSGPGGNGPDTSGGLGNGAAVASNAMLTIPLATLLGQAEHPGEAQGLGALDPALARQMAAAAARNPRSTWCITVTDTHGHAIGHGCAKAIQKKRKPGRPAPHAPRFTFTPTGDPGPDGGYGTWHLTIAGREYTVTLHPIPVTSCDHRYQTDAYRPGRLLRHLVEVRDGQCTQPTCVRTARRCDFEHAVPYDKGGRTCGCNGGCRCRRDHKVKQSPGWKVTQPGPGYHQWTTPSGRTYTTEPMRYPI